MLNSLERVGVLLCAVPLIKHLCRVSLGQTLSGSNDIRNSTYSVVLRNSSGHESHCTVCLLSSFVEKGGMALIKQVGKNSLNRIVFS